MAKDELARAAKAGLATLPADLRKVVNFDEYGIAGTKILAGLVYEETDPNLAGSKGMAVFREMGYDATLAMGLKATINPLRSADWFVQPASDDPVHVEHADLVHHSLWEFGSMSFDDLLRQSIKGMKQYGVHAAEIVYDIIRSGQFSGKWGWDKLAYRNPISLYRFNVEPVPVEGGGTRRELVEVVQRDPASGSLIYIPKDKLLLFTNDLEGENYLGHSVFRDCYDSWRYKRAIGRLEAIALERAGMGRLKATLPQDFTEGEAKMAKAIVENDRSHENAGIVTTEAVPIDVLHFTLEGAAFRVAWEAYDAAMLMPFLAQYLLLGQRGNSGAYALSQDHSQIQLTQLNGDANQFEQVINLSPGIPLLLAINYAGLDESKLPLLQHGDIGRKDMEMMGRTLLALSTGGWVVPTDQDEDTLRKFTDLPERDPGLSPEALAPLIQQVLPPTWFDKPHADRPVTTGGPMLKPGVGGRPPVQSPAAQKAQKQTLTGPVMGGSSSFAEMAERSIRARMPWARPRIKGGRVTAEDRVRVKAAEALLEYFEAAERRVLTKPDAPSVRLAKNRHPYVVQLGETREKRKIHVDPAAIVRRRGAGKVEAVLRGVGPKR